MGERRRREGERSRESSDEGVSTIEARCRVRLNSLKFNARRVTSFHSSECGVRSGSRASYLPVTDMCDTHHSTDCERPLPPRCR